MSKNCNVSQKFCKTADLPLFFGYSVDYFEKKIHEGVLKIDEHFFEPEQSKTKKARFWDIKAVENWIRRGNCTSSQNALIQELLK